MSPKKKGTTKRPAKGKRGSTRTPREPSPKELAYRGERRAEAARKSWETRRRRDAERERETYIVPSGGEEDERGVGENLWTFYDDLKDKGSEASEALERMAAGKFGSTVRVKLSGRRRDPLNPGKVQRWTRSRVIRLEDLEQLRGGGSVTHVLMKEAKDGGGPIQPGERPRAESEDEIWVTSLALELADDDDVDWSADD